MVPGVGGEHGTVLCLAGLEGVGLVCSRSDFRSLFGLLFPKKELIQWSAYPLLCTFTS